MSIFINLRAELQVGWRTVQLESNLMLRVYDKIYRAGLAWTGACMYQPQLLVRTLQHREPESEHCPKNRSNWKRMSVSLPDNSALTPRTPPRPFSAHCWLSVTPRPSSGLGASGVGDVLGQKMKSKKISKSIFRERNCRNDLSAHNINLTTPNTVIDLS